MHKILVIENLKEIRENLVENLELTGYKIIVAENGLNGIQIAKNEVPRFIVFDVVKPINNGYEVLEAIYSIIRDFSTIYFSFCKAQEKDIIKGHEQ